MDLPFPDEQFESDQDYKKQSQAAKLTPQQQNTSFFSIRMKKSSSKRATASPNVIRVPSNEEKKEMMIRSSDGVLKPEKHTAQSKYIPLKYPITSQWDFTHKGKGQGKG